MPGYILMNRNVETALLQINTKKESHFVEKIEVLNKGSLPFPVKYSQEIARRKAVENWISRRLLSEHRIGLSKVLNKTGRNRLESSLMSYSLSLSDGFWIKPEGDFSLDWNEINFFSNRFSYDVGNLIFGIDTTKPNYLTPDLTVNGRMEKTWRKKEGRTWLLKKGSAPYFEEPFNEKAVSTLLTKISKVPFVQYDVTFIQRYAVSICENFASEDIEFVSAADLVKTSECPSYLPVDMHLRERCKYFNIPNYKEFLDDIKIIDYLIGNMDRHLGNYGFLYDSESDRFVGPAPIFDNGSSLNCQDEIVQAEPINLVRQSSKRLAHELSHPEWFQLNKALIPELKDILSSVYVESAIDTDRAHAVELNLANRYAVLSDYIEREIELLPQKRQPKKQREKTEYEL